MYRLGHSILSEVVGTCVAESGKKSLYLNFKSFIWSLKRWCAFGVANLDTVARAAWSMTRDYYYATYQSRDRFTVVQRSIVSFKTQSFFLHHSALFPRNYVRITAYIHSECQAKKDDNAARTSQHGEWRDAVNTNLARGRKCYNPGANHTISRTSGHLITAFLRLQRHVRDTTTRFG